MKDVRTLENTDQENTLHIDQIQKEYKRIDSDWLLLHYKISTWMVIFALMVEFIMGVIMMNSDMLSSSVPVFIWKYMILPSTLNFICIFIDTLIIKSVRIAQNIKIYTISLNMVIICFILFTAHNTFTATYYIFTVAIMLTAIYASYYVTCITAVSSIVVMVISELFIQWDVDKISIFQSTLRLGDFLISLFILIAFSIVCMVLISYERKKNEASIQMEIERTHLKQSLQVDELTGIFNRKALLNAMKDMECNNTEDYYILAIIDIDHFKRINDNWGHHLGDRCLSEFARILKENCTKATPYRFGGDEFCLLFQNAHMEEAMATCEQMKAKLNGLKFNECPELKLTASFGLAAYASNMDSTRLLVHADHALYQAKETRNSVCVFQKPGKTM